MHRYLRELLICPKCKREIIWTVKEENKRHIINADIHCLNCGQNYFVKNRVGNFLINYKEPHPNTTPSKPHTEWFEKHPDQKEKLLNAPLNSLNSVDLSTLMYYLKEIIPNPTKEQSAYIKKIEKLFKRKYYYGNRNADTLQKEYIYNCVKDKDGFILDIASGGGGLVRTLLKIPGVDIIASDIDYHTMQTMYDDIPARAQSRLTRIAFDAAASPFRDNAAPVLTSRAGLGNIAAFTPIMNAINECYRTCGDIFYSYEQLFSENDIENLNLIIQYFAPRAEEIYKANTSIALMEEAGFKAVIENPIKVDAPKRPESEIVPGRWLDMLPIADTIWEYCVIIAKK